MNKELRKAIYNKQMQRNKYEILYRQNMQGIQKTTQPCSKLKKRLVRLYFREVCRS